MVKSIIYADCSGGSIDSYYTRQSLCFATMHSLVFERNDRLDTGLYTGNICWVHTWLLQ